LLVEGAGRVASASVDVAVSAPRELQGRQRECDALEALLAGVRAGESGVLVVRGDAGVGKTALLGHLRLKTAGGRLLKVAGVESEMELAYAGLHQLCAPLLDGLERLPEPQREALATAFGLRAGAAPNRFLVALAALTLLAQAAEREPLVCLVDDAQWLDREAIQALVFVARRLLAERIAMVFAVRESQMPPELAGLPSLVVTGLSDDAARAVLETVIHEPLDDRVRDRIVAETRGNPLALLELAHGSTAAQLAGGFGLPEAPALQTRIEQSFERQLEALPPDTRQLMLIAAAEPLGEPLRIWAAAERLGVEFAAAVPAATAGLLEIDAVARFRHPLVRSVVYRAATTDERQRAHRALAAVTDPRRDPDHCAWHRAQGTAAPDDDVADELERSASRAQARGGIAAAAAFHELAAGLTPEPARRARRALTAARAKHQAGATTAALALVAAAEAAPLDERGRAEAALLRAQIAFTSERGRAAPPLLLAAAEQLISVDVELAHDTYLEAFAAALFAGRLATTGGVRSVGEAIRAAARGAGPGRPVDLLAEGVAVLITDGYAEGAPLVERALDVIRDEPEADAEPLRWLWLATHVALDLGDDVTWDVLSDRQIRLAREAGALSLLPIALTSRAGLELWWGELAAAADLADEAEAVVEATGANLAPHAALALAALRGREAETNALVEAGRRDVALRGEGLWLTSIEWASAVLYNGLGRHEQALAAVAQAAERPPELGISTWAWPELVEAAVRSGNAALAIDALRRFSDITQASGTDWCLGLEARSRALVSEGDEAESLYREAIDVLGRTRLRPNLARAHLLYGEWLNAGHRRGEAREHLRTAYALFVAMGIDGFADRTRRELQAAGEQTARRTVRTGHALTAKEAQIARLAGQGLSNPEIGARLFISASTVQYHLRKVFAKLGITSRVQLEQALTAGR
jgi:DNA-binding CsgD family transcriptional regulator